MMEVETGVADALMDLGDLEARLGAVTATVAAPGERLLGSTKLLGILSEGLRIFDAFSFTRDREVLETEVDPDATLAPFGFRYILAEEAHVVLARGRLRDRDLTWLARKLTTIDHLERHRHRLRDIELVIAHLEGRLHERKALTV